MSPMTAVHTHETHMAAVHIHETHMAVVPGHGASTAAARRAGSLRMRRRRRDPTILMHWARERALESLSATAASERAMLASTSAESDAINGSAPTPPVERRTVI